MTRLTIRAPLVACLAMGVIAGSTVSAIAQMGGGAPSSSSSKSSSSSSSSQKVSRSLSKPLTAVQDALKANDYAGALTHIQEAQAVDGRTDYDNYIINQFLGNIYIGQKDWPKAEAAYQAMANSPAIPEESRKVVYGNLIQLALNTSDLPAAIKYGEMLKAMGPLESTTAQQLAIAYYNSGDTAKALPIAQAEVDAAKAAGKQPGQAMLQIVMGSQQKQNDPAAMQATLEGLATNYGSPDDWGRLIDLSFNMKGMSDIQALYLYRLRVLTNATTSLDDYAIMATITTKAGYPGETVAVLEHGMARGAVKAGDKAGSQLAAARAKVGPDKASLPSVDAQARARKIGDYDVKLAEVYYGYGRFAEAEEAAQRAISKGGVKDASEAPMVLGMSLAAEGKNAEAVAAFAKVTNANDQKIAHLWTLYTQRKYGATPAAH